MSDVIIVGAGITGATLALALKRAMGGALEVKLADPALAGRKSRLRSFRALAVAPDGRASLERLGVWSAIAAHAQPIIAMAITDSRPAALPNPVFLTFESSKAATCDEPLAHMILADVLQDKLLDDCANAGVRFEAMQAVGFVAERHGLSLTFSDGRRETSRLLAAADGARSRLRHAARIQTLGRSYRQSAIVATLRHDRDHGGRAVQHFLPSGPIALLPLRAADGSGRRTSIVWTELHAEAARLAALPAPEFIAALEDQVGFDLGSLALEDQPRTYPLDLMLARRMTAPRFALVGDAARIIHPLAGQGLNLGLRDATALADRIIGHAELGLDAGAREVLQGYEQDRRAGSAVMAATTDALNRLFSNDVVALRSVRDIGLGVVDRLHPLKRLLVDQAAGRFGAEPSLPQRRRLGRWPL